jgi:hypothetical protein
MSRFEVDRRSTCDPDTGENFEGWTVLHVSPGMGWGIGHVFKHREFAESVCRSLNDAVALDRDHVTPADLEGAKK